MDRAGALQEGEGQALTLTIQDVLSNRRLRTRPITLRLHFKLKPGLPRPWVPLYPGQHQALIRLEKVGSQHHAQDHRPLPRLRRQDAQQLQDSGVRPWRRKPKSQVRKRADPRKGPQDLQRIQQRPNHRALPRLPKAKRLVRACLPTLFKNEENSNLSIVLLQLAFIRQVEEMIHAISKD